MIEKLTEIVLQHTENQDMSITGDTVLTIDLGLNSYELIELICEVEDKFDIEIPDRAINSFKTVQNVMDFITANS
jgi:acyl carrier protein